MWGLLWGLQNQSARWHPPGVPEIGEHSGESSLVPSNACRVMSFAPFIPNLDTKVCLRVCGVTSDKLARSHAFVNAVLTDRIGPRSLLVKRKSPSPDSTKRLKGSTNFE